MEGGKAEFWEIEVASPEGGGEQGSTPLSNRPEDAPAHPARVGLPARPRTLPARPAPLALQNGCLQARPSPLVRDATRSQPYSSSTSSANKASSATTRSGRPEGPYVPPAKTEASLPLRFARANALRSAGVSCTSNSIRAGILRPMFGSTRAEQNRHPLHLRSRDKHRGQPPGAKPLGAVIAINEELIKDHLN